MYEVKITVETMAQLSKLAARAQGAAFEARDAADTAMKKAQAAEKAANDLADLTRAIMSSAECVGVSP